MHVAVNVHRHNKVRVFDILEVAVNKRFVKVNHQAFAVAESRPEDG